MASGRALRTEGDAQLNAEWQDITARLAKLGAEQRRREAEAATVREAIAKLDATLPLSRQREVDVKACHQRGRGSAKIVCGPATTLQQQGRGRLRSAPLPPLRDALTIAELFAERLHADRAFATESREYPGAAGPASAEPAESAVRSRATSS